MGIGATSSAVVIGAIILFAQVILPAAFDLIGSITLLGLGFYAGWKAKSNA